MNNADYWRKRFEILENSSHEKADNYLQSIENIYRDAELSVKRDIESFYARFASNNKVSLVDAKKILTAGQLEEFRWSVYDYIKIGEQLNISDEWKRKLENASTRFHISRLESIKLQIQQQIEVLYANRIDELDNLFKQMILDNYTRSVFEIQKYLGIGWDFTAINQNKLDLLISKPWTTDNRTFSDRVWTNKINLINDIQKHLIQGLLRGDAPQKIVNAIQGKFNTDKHKISRLVHTETSYFNAISKKQMYSDLEVDRIEIVETLDSRTCDICKSFDGKVIKLSQYEAGVTVPPFHPNCRGTTCPYYDDMQGERIARNQDGEVYYIPSNMTYEEWEKTFVNGGSKDGLINSDESDIINLTDEEKWAINEYVSSGSYKINGLLRLGEELPEELLEFQKHLDSALKKMPKYEGVVYRSLTFDRHEDLVNFAHGHKVGHKVYYQAYTSTSVNTSFYHEKPDIVIKINSKNGRDIRRYNPKENEILYDRDMKFLIKSATFRNGIYFLEAEEVLC